MVSAQEYIEKKYPTKLERMHIKKLNIHSKNLEGELNLTDFINLERLDCGYNQLTSLNLSGLTKLEALECYNNFLVNLDYSLFNENKLTFLNMTGNNLHAIIPQNISCFSKFVNLEILWIGTSDDEIKAGRYNNFVGSLESLKSLTKLDSIFISNTDIDGEIECFPKSLEKIICSIEERPLSKVKSIVERLNESNDFVLFKGKYLKKISEDIVSKIKSFNHSKLTKEQRLLITELIPNKMLKERYIEYGLCRECDQIQTGSQWCQFCNAKHFQQEFKNWTSGNSTIDELIQKHQLKVTDEEKFLEWIPYDRFTDIEYLADGGFGTVYKAKWSGSNHATWVVLKILNESRNMTADFLQEFILHKMFDDDNLVVRCYGISQDLQTKNYMIVMEYIPDGNLRQYLRNNYAKLNFKDKIFQLYTIVNGLYSIHKQGLIHRDFHSGNILKYGCLSYITDLGLSRPANEENKEENIYGIIPYVAPEILLKKSYTQLADIYSFGMIAYELLSGLPPYHDRPYNVDLALGIQQGVRPRFKIKLPQLLENLIKRCWDTDLEKRPTAEELKKILGDWRDEIKNGKNTEFFRQIKEAEEFNESLPDEIRFPSYKLHPGVVLNSKLINTKQITELLLQNKDKSGTKDLDLDINDMLGKLKIEDDIEIKKITQVEFPPKGN